MKYTSLIITGAIFLLTIIIGTALLFREPSTAKGALSTDVPSLVNNYRVYDLFASTTAETTLATTTSGNSTGITAYADSSGRIIDGTADLRGAKKVTLYFSQGGLTHANTGTSTFSVQTSRNGSDWNTNNMLIAATSTSPTFAYVSQLVTYNVGPATTTRVYFMEDFGGYSKLRCVVTIVGTTEAGCAVAVTY